MYFISWRKLHASWGSVKWLLVGGGNGDPILAATKLVRIPLSVVDTRSRIQAGDRMMQQEHAAVAAAAADDDDDDGNRY